MHSNGLFLTRPKLTALKSRPLELKGVVEGVEVKGKKKSKGIFIQRVGSRLKLILLLPRYCAKMGNSLISKPVFKGPSWKPITILKSKI